MRADEPPPFAYHLTALLKLFVLCIALPVVEVFPLLFVRSVDESETKNGIGNMQLRRERA